MSIKFKILCISVVIYILMQAATFFTSASDFRNISMEQKLSNEELNKQHLKKQAAMREASNGQEINKQDLLEGKRKDYPNEKRASPAYDTVMGKDGLPHYRLLFWVPKEASKFTPYSDEGVETDVSEHGSVEKWTVEDTNITNDKEKLVYILVPKTFAFLYGNGFEKVIHLKYNF